MTSLNNIHNFALPVLLKLKSQPFIAKLLMKNRSHTFVVLPYKKKLTFLRSFLFIKPPALIPFSPLIIEQLPRFKKLSFGFMTSRGNCYFRDRDALILTRLHRYHLSKRFHCRRTYENFIL